MGRFNGRLFEKGPGANLTGQSRGPPLYSSVAVDNRVRVCMKTTSPSPSPAIPTAEGRRGPTHHDVRAAVGQENHGTARLTQPSPTAGKTIPRAPSSEPLPREEALRVRREYLSFHLKTLRRIPYFDTVTPRPAPSLSEHSGTSNVPLPTIPQAPKLSSHSFSKFTYIT